MTLAQPRPQRPQPQHNLTLAQADLEKKIAVAAKDLLPGYKRHLENAAGINPTNAITICDYIAALKVEIKPSDYYRENIINLLTMLAKKIKSVDFKDLTRDDIISFLQSFEKTEEADPLHKWVGTYNLFRIHLLRFFKWLYTPEVETNARPKPAVVTNIPRLKRNEISIYTPSDLWTAQDDLLFLKYCPVKRDKCYHAISRDLSARPAEILKLKIRNLSFKMVGQQQYAEVTINSGKSKSRTIPLINSLPYLKDYLSYEHPVPGNPNAPLIASTGKAIGRHISTKRLHAIYDNHKRVTFPRLLQSPDVAPEDKPAIEELLKKPWNPYVRRHSALTEKSMILKENVLRQHAGWTQNSQMQLKYLHYFGNESSESLLEAYGLVDHSVQLDQLKPKQCPNCSEGNRPDAKFCVKCRMVLSYDSYNETIENQKEKEDRLTTIENQFNAMQSQIHSLLSSLGSIQDQNQVNQMAKTLYSSKILKKED
jgi:integrase